MMDSSKRQSKKKQQQVSKLNDTNTTHQRLVAFGRCYFNAIPDTTVVKVRTTQRSDGSSGCHSDMMACSGKDWTDGSSDECKGEVKERKGDNNGSVGQADQNLGYEDHDENDDCMGVAVGVWEADIPPWSSSTRGTNNSKDQTIQQVACTSQSSLFLTESGKVYQQGLLHGYHLPTPTKIDIPLALKCTQIAAGRHFCLALMEGGVAVVSWGAGHFGQLGIGLNYIYNSQSTSRQNHDNHDPITFTSTPCIIERLLPHSNDSPIVSIAAGDWHALALTKAGRVWAWGCNRNLQCGRKVKSSNGSSNNNQQATTSSPAPTITVPLPVPLGPSLLGSNSSSHTNNNLSPSASFHVTHIAAGRSHSMIIAKETTTSVSQSENGKTAMSTVTKNVVYCWGNSHSGQCGNVVTRRSVPGVLPSPVESLRDVDIRQISAAGNHSMALTAQGRILCWGSHLDGQIGIGVVATTSATYLGAVIENDDSTTTTSMSNNHLPSTSAIQCKPRLVSDLDFVAIAAGQEWTKQQHLQFQQVRDSSSQSSVTSMTAQSSSATASLLSSIPRVTSIHAGATYSAATNSLGQLYVWGSNDAGQLGIPTPPTDDLSYMHEDNNALRVVVNTPNTNISSSRSSFGNASTSSSLSAFAFNNSSVSTSVNNIQHIHNRPVNVQTFDSSHIVLLPTRVEVVNHINVQQVACGPNHMWCIGRTRTSTDLENLKKSAQHGKTLHEVQMEQQSIQKQLLSSPSSPNNLLTKSKISEHPHICADAINVQRTIDENKCKAVTTDSNTTPIFEDRNENEPSYSIPWSTGPSTGGSTGVVEHSGSSGIANASSHTLTLLEANQDPRITPASESNSTVTGAASYTTTDLEEITETDVNDGYDDDEEETAGDWRQSTSSKKRSSTSDQQDPHVLLQHSLDLSTMRMSSTGKQQSQQTQHHHQLPPRDRPHNRGRSLIKRISQRIMRRRKAAAASSLMDSPTANALALSQTGGSSILIDSERSVLNNHVVEVNVDDIFVGHDTDQSSSSPRKQTTTSVKAASTDRFFNNRRRKGTR